MSTEATPGGNGLAVKLAEVMAEVGRVAKRGRNDFHRYNYVREDDLMEEVRSKLAERSVVLLPSVTAVSEREATTDKGKRTMVTTVHVRLTFVDGEHGETLSCDWAGQGDDPGDKGLYKAYTGALKYFIMKTFLIPTGDDPEGDATTDRRHAPAAGRSGKPSGAQNAGAQNGGSSERPASAKQQGLVRVKASEAGLSGGELTAILQWHGGVANLERLAAARVDGVLAAVADKDATVADICDTAAAGDKRATAIRDKYLTAA